MSDDASPSSAAQHDAPSVDTRAESPASHVTWNLPSGRPRVTRSRAQSHSQRRKKKKSRRRRNPGLSRKLEFVTHLLRNLDTLVFAELSGLYYMECSMFRFALRSIGHYMYLTPKDESFPFFMPATRIHAVFVVVPNIICILLHLFCSLPVGPEHHRGYMHGGLVVDFVGQKPSTSRIYYILVDVAILIVQCLMLTVHTERERLRLTLKTFRPLVPDVTQETAPTIEDLDAEERGLSREASNASSFNETEDIELRPIRRPSETGEANDANGESSELLSRESSNEDSSRSYLSDVLSSGNGILGEYHLIHSMRTAAVDLESTAAHSLRTIGYGATLAAIQAGRRGTANGPERPAPTSRRS